MTERENWLRAVEFRNPEWIPCEISFSRATWYKYREKLEELVIRHPLIFRSYQKGSAEFHSFPGAYQKGKHYCDPWGCLWDNVQEGLEGQVIEHPLANWDALSSYQLPDVLVETERGGCTIKHNWDGIKERVEEERKNGFLTSGYGDRFFDRLHFLRGFENLMVDFITEPLELSKLIELILESNVKLIRKWLEIGVDVMHFHGDIGTQNALMVSPKLFRKYLKPGYKRMYLICQEAGVHVDYSSDGNILEIIDDLVECGVSVHDPQIEAIRLESLINAYKGKLCAKVNLDQTFSLAKPKDINKLIKKIVAKFVSSAGGLMFRSFVTPDVPLENIEAYCQAMEEYCL